LSIKNKELYPSYVTILTAPNFSITGTIDVEDLKSQIIYKDKTHPI
jgi:hypothetical protein